MGGGDGEQIVGPGILLGPKSGKKSKKNLKNEEQNEILLIKHTPKCFYLNLRARIIDLP